MCAPPKLAGGEWKVATGEVEALILWETSRADFLDVIGISLAWEAIATVQVVYWVYI